MSEKINNCFRGLRIVRYTADFEKQTLKFFGVNTTNEQSRLTITFSGVQTHHLEGATEQNLLYDIEIVEPEAFYELYQAILDRQQIYGYPFRYKKPEELAALIRQHSLKVYRVLPAKSGLAGFVLAESIRLSRARKQ